MMLQKSGVYLLVASNCGDLNLASFRLQGTVRVRGYYGYLPGNEYPKLVFYKTMSFVYFGLSVVWVGISLRWHRELLTIQKCIGVVTVVSFVETILCHWFYIDWNSVGRRDHLLFGLATFVGVSKDCFSYLLVLVAALGWGVSI